MSERLLRTRAQRSYSTRTAAELLDANCKTAVGWHPSGKLPGGRRCLDGPQRKEHLDSGAVTRGRERTAVRQSRDEREPEAAFFRVRPMIHAPSAMVCNRNDQFVADLLRTHMDQTWLARWICVLHRVGNGFAYAELDGTDLHVRQTGLAGKARDGVAERGDALRSCIGAYLKHVRHRTSFVHFPVFARSKPSPSGTA
jgi:hypothetical protein